jgi:hypothetical protein
MVLPCKDTGIYRFSVLFANAATLLLRLNPAPPGDVSALDLCGRGFIGKRRFPIKMTDAYFMSARAGKFRRLTVSFQLLLRLTAGFGQAL